MEPFGSVWEERMYNAAGALLAGARDVPGLARGMAEFHALAEELANGAGAAAAACGPGCPHCCALNVSVLLPEAAAIAARLAEATPLPELPTLVGRLDDQRLRVRWMEDGERVWRQIGCSFLDRGGSCAIHPYRPLMCRGVTSFDAALCRVVFDPTEPDPSRDVPTDMVRKRVMDGAFLALVRAAGERGMDTRGIELAAGVGAFLARPDLGEALLAGQRLPGELWE